MNIGGSPDFRTPKNGENRRPGDVPLAIGQKLWGDRIDPRSENEKRSALGRTDQGDRFPARKMGGKPQLAGWLHGKCDYYKWMIKKGGFRYDELESSRCRSCDDMWNVYPHIITSPHSSSFYHLF